MVMQGSRQVASKGNNCCLASATAYDDADYGATRGKSMLASLAQMLLPSFGWIIDGDDGSRRTRPWFVKSRVKICQIFASELPAALRQLTTTTTSSPSKTTRAAAATGGCSSGAAPGAIAALLKLFLIGCFYTIAFVSLLVIILYLNQNLANQCSGNKEVKNQQQKELSIEASVSEAANRTSNGHSLHILSRRSVSHVDQAMIPPDSSNQSPVSRRLSNEGNLNNNLGRAHPPSSPMLNSTDPKPQNQQVPMLTTSYSPNNRGSLAPSSSTRSLSVINMLDRVQPYTGDSNKWIPIVGNRRLHPARPLGHSTSMATPVTRHFSINRPAINQSVTPPGKKPASRLEQPSEMALNRNNQYPHHAHQDTLIPQQSYRNSHYHIEEPYHRHHNDHWPPRHHWRKPRLNSAYDILPAMRGKIYRRVLICDKTLVSLDYVRAFPFLPDHPNIPVQNFESEFDNNFIDFDANFDKFLSDRRATNGTEPNIETSYEVEEPDRGASNAERQATAGPGMERRSLLTDEDPLVRCDMWDLEKGLKNRKPPESILRQAERADFDTVRDAINRCRQLTEKSLPPEDDYRDGIEVMSSEDLVSLFSMKRGLIPGTKWCGLGDIASSYNDLGPKHRIDICCRAHDHCPIRVKPFRNDYGVMNLALYTKSHCDCDADFYRCLREARSRTADMLGNLYFNVMKLQCIHEERLKICRETRPVALGFERCIKYEENPMKTVFKFTAPPVAY